MIMTSIFRCLKAEFLKCKHSVLLYIHILIPLLGAIIFAGYFLVSGWDVQTKVSAYLEVLAVSFPFLAGIIVGIVVQIEHQAGHYQLMLGTIPSRPATYIGKILLLIIGAIGATCGCMFMPITKSGLSDMITSAFTAIPCPISVTSAVAAATCSE